MTDLEMIVQNLTSTLCILRTGIHSHRRFSLCVCVYIYIWQHSTWPHLLLVFWQVVIIFIFCCCSLQPSLYTVDQYVIPLLLLWFGTDNVWEDKPVQAERNAVLRHFHMIYVGFMSSLFLPFTYCIASDMQHGCKRGGRIKWGCETDKLLMLWADATEFLSILGPWLKRSPCMEVLQGRCPVTERKALDLSFNLSPSSCRSLIQCLISFRGPTLYPYWPKPQVNKCNQCNERAYINHSLPNLQLSLSGCVYFSVRLCLPLQPSLNVQTGLCIEHQL